MCKQPSGIFLTFDYLFYVQKADEIIVQNLRKIVSHELDR